MRIVFAFSLALGVSVAAAAAPDSDLAPPGAVRVSGELAQSLIDEDFRRFDPDYAEHRATLGDRLTALRRTLIALQANGNDMECANQIYLEAKWLHRYTAFWTRLEHRLDDLAASLDHPDQAFAAEQSPTDGLWGACYEEPFFKVEATALALIELEGIGEKPRYAIRMPPPFDDPPEALEHVKRLLISDVAHTGVDHRGELGNIGTVASIAYFKEYLQDYLNETEGLPRNEGGPGARTGEYRTLLLDFIDGWQDPVSGYWGPLYRSEGRVFRVADLSYTFHIISYRKGDVHFWPQIVATTMAIRNEPYPFGWMHAGEYVNHNNYDVAKILKLGWPYMSSGERKLLAEKIRGMLRWTLESSLQADGSFKTVPAFFSSKGADFYFGVAFLKTIGYWDKSNRFWTTEDFPEAAEVCDRIKAKLVAMALKSHESESALGQLKNAC
jgi:hypothetical protein